jgi:hypothetical protein
MGLAVMRVILLFLFDYKDVYYPCALVDWFIRVRLDPVAHMWVVKPDTTHGRQLGLLCNGSLTVGLTWTT